MIWRPIMINKNNCKLRFRKAKVAYSVNFLILLIILLFVGCGAEKTVEKKLNHDEKTVYENTVKVSVEKVTRFYEAVGTLRPETETSIEAQINAQIKKVLVAPGTSVVKGQSLILLDNRQYLSQLDRAKEGLRSSQAAKEQARQGLEGAKAAFVHAEADYRRTKKYFTSQAATAQQLEAAESVWKQARAAENNAAEALKASDSGIKQARELVNQAELTLAYTIIKASSNGVILKKTAEVGDIAIPGRQLLLMRTTSLLRIEANVREGLISKIRLGQKLDVEIKNLDSNIKAVVGEIEPFADPGTRTFIVKAALPEIEGLYPGMYGKLLIPELEEEAILLPIKAVKTIGQLQLVIVKENGKFRRRFVTTGMTMGDNVEILSGLNGTETVAY